MSEIERYTIKGKIGQGGVGAVYRAFDNSLQRDVAIKRLLNDDGSEETAAILAKEAGLLSKLQHPNIVTVYDVGVDDDGGYVIMEIIEGETFDATVARGALTADDFVLFVDQTLEALIAAQQIQLLHRDIKPSNVMVSWLPSGRFQIKVLDFGLAKLSMTPSLQTVNQSDAIMGSIYFMSPEQFDREPLDARTDLYSLGCLFYYGLTGKYPFDGDSAAEVMIAHIEHDLRPLNQLRPDLPEIACDWVMRLISKDPADRPRSASTAMEEFEPALAAIRRASNPEIETAEIPPSPPSPNRPTLITGPVAQLENYPPSLHTTGYQMQLQQKKSPALAIILCSLAAALIIGGIWFFLNQEDSEPAPIADNTQEEPPSPPSPRRVNHPDSEQLISFDSSWKYIAKTEADNWFRRDFDDSTWAKGKAPLGFGDDIIATVIGESNGPTVYYLRKPIKMMDVPESADRGKFIARFQFDDGFRLFLNGTELVRKNLPEGEVEFALGTRKREQEEEFVSFELPHGSLRDGKNVFAVALYQASTRSTDLRFAMVLDFVETGGSLPPPLPKG